MFELTMKDGEDEQDTSGWDTGDALDTLDTAEEQPAATSKQADPELSLLINGKPMYLPDVQRVGVQTEDQLHETEACLLSMGTGRDASLERARLQSPQLVSDMQAFKAANPTGTLGDFVRWYSPSDWLGSRTGGRLSSRMAAENNTWAVLWNQCQPLPAAQQPPLYDALSQMQKALHYLETLPPADLLEQLVCVVLSCVHRVFSDQEDTTFVPVPELCCCCGPQTLSKPLAVLQTACGCVARDTVAGMPQPPAHVPTEEEGERVCLAVGAVETAAARLTSAYAKLGARLGRVVDRLVLVGSSPLTSDEEKHAVQLLVGDIDELLPDRREYDVTVQSSTPGIGTGFCHAIATVTTQSRRGTEVAEDVCFSYITTGECMHL